MGAQFRDPFVDRHHNMLVMERINSMSTSKATCGSTIETPTTYEKMDAQRCISQTTPPNYIETYQTFFNQILKAIFGISLHKKDFKAMTSKNSFFKVALPSLPPLPQGFGGLRRSPRSLGVGAFTPQGVARHAGLVGNVDVSRPRVAPSGEVVR